MLLACGAFTTKVLELDNRLAVLIGGKEGQITKAVTDLDAVTVKNGLKIEAKQSVGDGHRVFILLEITSLTGQKLDDRFHFEDYSLNMSESSTYAISIGPVATPVTNDGRTISYTVEIASEEPVNEQEVSLVMKNWKRTIAETDTEETVLSGTWKVDFRLKYKNISQSSNPHVSIPVGKGAICIEKVELSPISCFIEVSVSKFDKDLENAWNNRKHEVTLILENDVEKKVYIDGSSWIGNGKFSTGSLEGVLGELIDLDKVKGMRIDGHQVPL